MKNKLLLLIFSVFALNGFAQTQIFPNGVYLSLEQLKSQTPAFDVNLRIIQRTQGDIGFNGGNDYEIKSDIDSLNKKFVRKTVYAYVKNDSLFLNCIHHKLSTWYALALTKGNFIAFRGAMSNEKVSKRVSPYGFGGGAIGGAIAGSQLAKMRFLYVLSLRTGNVRPLDKDFLSERLKENQGLSDQFNGEKDQESESVLIKYINLLNQVIVFNPASSSEQKK